MEPANTKTSSRKTELLAEVETLPEGVDKIEYLMEKLLSVEATANGSGENASINAGQQRPNGSRGSNGASDSEKAVALVSWLITQSCWEM